jgi:hypothetical protein
MEYVDRDFEGLLLNVQRHDLGTDLFKVFPILTKYDEFQAKVAGLKKELILRYIVLAFDRNSPVVAINDILERRVEAAHLAGFVPNKNNEFALGIETMIRSLNPLVNHMVIRYCMLLGDTDYTVMVTYEDSLLKELDRLINYEADQKTDPTNEKKKEIITNISTLREGVNMLKDEFLAKNVDFFLSRSLSEFTESKRIDMSPEAYAIKLKGWDNVSMYFNKINPLGKKKK